MKNKILLTILPVFWPKMPPLGLACLKSYMAKQGLVADVLDLNAYFYNLATPELKRSWLQSCNAGLEENIIKIIKSRFPAEFNSAFEKMCRYDCIGFSCFKSNFKATLEVAAEIKPVNKGARILFGGPEITRRYFKTKGEFDAETKSLADLLVVGEGERALAGYISGMIKDRLVKFDEFESLDDYPELTYDGFDLSLYSKKAAISLMFSRGCARKCRFCSERLLYKGLRTRSVDGLLDEIGFNIARNGVKNFIFHDSMFNCDLKKLDIFCDGVLERFGSINWEAQIGVRRDMGVGLFEKMKKSGCYNLFIGLESGCGATLEAMNKGFRPEDALGFFKKMKTAGLNFGISLIVGYPGESDEDFKESLLFVISNKAFIPKVEQINPFVRYDGTDAWGLSGAVGKDEASGRLNIFTRAIKDSGIKYTNAFIGNLLEKDDGI